MNELCCTECGHQIGWLSRNSGPMPWIECDECHEENERRERNECRDGDYEE